jgi:hypothetical protein
VNRGPVSPLIIKGIEIAQARLGMEELSKRLEASETLVRAWQLGHIAMPESKFLRLVDILTELDPKWTVNRL